MQSPIRASDREDSQNPSIDTEADPAQSQYPRLADYAEGDTGACEPSAPSAPEPVPPPANASAASDLDTARLIADLRKENVWLRMVLERFQNEERQFASDDPLSIVDGSLAQIVPPIAGARLRGTVGSPSLAGYLLSADAWHSLLTRFLTRPSRVLDMGCGCGKMIRNLMHHPHIQKYIGIDAYRPSIDFCQNHLATWADGKLEFHYIDAVSDAYNPQGTVRGVDVVFPAEDGSIDLAFAASLFTHLLEDDAKHYLREVRRVLAPGGAFLPSIHVEPAPGQAYSGNEIRIDVDPGYFIQLAEDAGLRFVESLGNLFGQQTLHFTVVA